MLQSERISSLLIQCVWINAGVYLHDPAALLAAVNPSLFTYSEGVVRVQTCGIMRGLTIFDNTKKRSAAFCQKLAADNLT